MTNDNVTLRDLALSIIDAYLDGEHAGEYRTYEENPYLPDTAEHYAWRRGETDGFSKLESDRRDN